MDEEYARPPSFPDFVRVPDDFFFELVPAVFFRQVRLPVRRCRPLELVEGAGLARDSDRAFDRRLDVLFRGGWIWDAGVEY